MTTLTEHVPAGATQTADAGKKPELLNAQQCAKLANIHVASWHRLVKANKAPRPVEGCQWRWDATEVAQWVQSRNVPSAAEIERNGKLVALLRSGVAKETVRNAIAQGLLSEADVEEIRVRVGRGRALTVQSVKFIPTAVVALLRDIETGNRSFAQRNQGGLPTHVSSYATGVAEGRRRCLALLEREAPDPRLDAFFQSRRHSLPAKAD